MTYSLNKKVMSRQSPPINFNSQIESPDILNNTVTKYYGLNRKKKRPNEKGIEDYMQNDVDDGLAHCLKCSNTIVTLHILLDNAKFISIQH